MPSGRTTTFSLVAVLALALMAALGAGPAAAKGGAAEVTIQPWPGGLRGSLQSGRPALCSEARRVVVYEQSGGEPRPGKDSRVGSDLAAPAARDYSWSVETPELGRFYALAAAKRGCLAARSGTVAAQPFGATEDAAGRQYPPCSAYVSEGPTRICRIENLYYNLDRQSPLRSCLWGEGGGNCPGRAEKGPYPFAEDSPRNDSYARLEWFWDAGASLRRLNFITYSTYLRQVEVAHIFGHVTVAGSPRFSVEDAVAMGDRPADQSDHFYTPDLPGRGQGEVGGPLSINVQNNTGSGRGAEAWLNGYLYLKP